MFHALLQGLSRHLPSQCAVCHAWPAHSICEACVATFAQPLPRCSTCALPVAPGVRQCDVMAELYRVTTAGLPEFGGTFPCKPPNAMVSAPSQIHGASG